MHDAPFILSRELEEPRKFLADHPTSIGDAASISSRGNTWDAMEILLLPKADAEVRSE
jgi:hypothetical protein